MKRRQFLKLTGGLAGILAAGRAPAYAQGTKLHILRWNDFIPQADVELKRQAVEAGKALGAEVTFEVENHGREASSAPTGNFGNHTTHATLGVGDDAAVRWEETSYRGLHYMTITVRPSADRTNSFLFRQRIGVYIN